MANPILYLGDTTLTTAAAYLGGVMASAGLRFDYLPSHQACPPDAVAGRSLYILSDYPAKQLPTPIQERIVHAVELGAGLLMIGGWESYHGLGGDWDGTPISQALPVEISSIDDRLNCDHPVLIRRLGDHEVTRDLPWETRPPIIGGLNKVVAKPIAQTLLEASHLSASFGPGGLTVREASRDPLLVVGSHWAGRTACLMTDAAPHWVGPFVDWGPHRVTARAPAAEAIEVGNLYAQFFTQLIRWTMGTASK
jgi:hypothetical protein